ncbi:hypothetical protein CRX72_17840 [Pantoea sp. BRM17]|nr:hypothetical protein CRX72_17840 [Pantoea sp. BRM17]
MLEDIRAIVPAAALSVFINTLDETRYATVECLQSEENCALLASAIVVWRQLGLGLFSLFWCVAIFRRYPQLRSNG